MAILIDGKEKARQSNEAVKKKISDVFDSADYPPRLVSITAGDGEDAQIYVNMQKKAAEFLGIEFCALDLDPHIGSNDLIREIEKLNSDDTVTSIIVQKPLPLGIEHSAVVSSIKPVKDAEGVHPYNLGKIFRREADIVPCTPGAIMKLLRMQEVDLYGKEVVIIGHSAVVGKPLSLMMMNEMATTTVCHLATAEKGDIVSHARRADILVVAVGKAEMVKGDWVKDGAIVIDVGINRKDGKIVGDIDFKEVSERASMITPVPGGVGPVTVSILMRNVYRSYRRQHVEV